MTGQQNSPAVGGVQLVDTPDRPARPAGYWERVIRIVDAAPPLEDWQRAAIRAAFHQPALKEAAA